MRFCSSCGWSNADTASVCKCGKPLGAPPARAGARAGIPGTAPSRPSPPARNPALLLAMGIASLVLGALAFFLADRPLAGVGGILTGLAVAFQGLKGLRAERESGASGATTNTGDGTVWRSPWRSFYSGTFYDTVGRRTPGYGILYLLALEGALWLVSAAMGYDAFSAYRKAELEQIITQVPPITIRDGRVSIDAPQPHTIRFAEKTVTQILILDTTGEITGIENQPQVLLLLSANKVHVRNSSGQIRIHDLSRTKSFDVNQPLIRQWLSRYTIPGFAFGYALFVLVAFAYRLAQAAIYAGVGLGLASIFQKTLGYGASLRLAIAAMTPMLLVDSALGWVGFGQASGFWWWVLCAGVTLSFLAFGVKSLEEE